MQKHSSGRVCRMIDIPAKIRECEEEQGSLTVTHQINFDFQYLIFQNSDNKTK